MAERLETLTEEVDEKRYRNFMIMLYEDSTTYDYKEVLFDLKGSFKNYAYIKHQPETNEKKAHTHFILSLDNARTISSIAKRVGVAPNYFQPIKSLRASCRYLIHLDTDDKIKYNLSDVVVSNSFMRKFYGAFDDLKTEGDVNKNVKETNDFLKDDTEPDSDISALGNVQGLLPPGPVDTLLNIPFTFLSIVSSSLSGTCVPLTGDFVFGSTLTIPCFGNLFYDNVPSALMVFINLIPSAFILINYFKHLYKKVDRAVSLQTTAEDEWGVI